MELNGQFSLESLLVSEKNKRRGFTDGDKFWSEDYLWKNAKGLTPKKRSLKELLDLQIKWTVKNVFDFCIHIKKVQEADLSYPIIFNAEGKLMDGYHRLCRALLDGKEEISYVQFTIDPTPERIIPGGKRD